MNLPCKNLIRRSLYSACALLFSASVLSSCDDSTERYSTLYRCQFSFKTQLHITSILTRTIDNPGSFALVKVTTTNGVKVLHIESNNGTDQETIRLNTEEENRLIGSVGANNSILVGCTNFNGMAAYDAQCPNCLEDFTGTNYPLRWAAKGQQVECAKCGRQYLLHSMGACTEGGKRLIEYRVWLRDNGAILTVSNN
ncbi:MAG: hypothetical protein ACI3YM_09320 [Prevotella sp.]